MSTRYATTEPDADWKTRWTRSPFIPGIWNQETVTATRILELRDRLVSLGGWAVCVRDPRLAAVLLMKGSDTSGEGAEMRPGEPNSCHDNSAALVLQDPSLVYHYGYALSEDGMWREHSWCVKPNGGIIETTVERVAYFGAPDGD